MIQNATYSNYYSVDSDETVKKKYQVCRAAVVFPLFALVGLLRLVGRFIVVLQLVVGGVVRHSRFVLNLTKKR